MTAQQRSPHFIGSYMQDKEDEIRFYAKKRKSILLIGEPGTGKDLAATIAANALDPSVPVHEVNLTNFKGELAYANLFGCEKGSHSKANTMRKGALEEAAGKLCFLNEIGTSLDTEVQKALLRFIEQKNIVRVGGSYANPVKVDTYIMGACQSTESLGKDILRRFERKIELPPLVWRIRRANGKFISDIMEIAKDHLIKRDVVMIKIDFAEKLLLRNSYPGNIGDLVNMLDTECDIAERYWNKVANSQKCPYGISVIFSSNLADIDTLITKLESLDDTRLLDFINNAGMKEIFALSQVFNELRDRGTMPPKLNKMLHSVGETFNKWLQLQCKDSNKKNELAGLINMPHTEINLPPYILQLLLYDFPDIGWAADNWLSPLDLPKWQPTFGEIPSWPDRIIDDFNCKWRQTLKDDIAEGKIKENPYFYAIRQEYGSPSISTEHQVSTKALWSKMPDEWLEMPFREIEKRVILSRVS